ncbi:hypothetical protein H1Q59_08045 [Holosporaceae bacterium 'Namur']|nr:hypothetical protein [Holosporaceae bacterium 'Namur']
MQIIIEYAGAFKIALCDAGEVGYKPADIKPKISRSVYASEYLMVPSDSHSTRSEP